MTTLGLDTTTITALANATISLITMPVLELEDESVSPVTLSSEWSRLARLLLLASMAMVGSVGNVFMISAVMIEDHLKKTGNAFVVNVALADLLITGLLIPTSVVVLLAQPLPTPGHPQPPPDSLGVCRFQWFLAATAFMVIVLTSAVTGAENYIRLCCTQNTHSSVVSPAKTTATLITIWTICCIASGLQFAFDTSFDYCTRKYTGFIPFQVTVGVVLVFLPVFLTFVCFLAIIFRVRSVKMRPNFKPSITFSWDYNLMKTNFYSFILFLIFWLPFGVVLGIGTSQRIPNRIFYNLAWFALSRSCVNNLIFMTNRHFRNAYINLFNYCCCKTTVSFSRRQRGEGNRPSGDVRVHIIPGYNMYSYTSPQRANRETPCGKRTSGRPNGRDVYEL